MPTFTELLPPSKTSPKRSIRYTPVCRGAGVAELTDSRTHTRYAVAVQPFGGVRFTKADGETYVATAGTCDCAGFTFGRGRLCKHLEAVHALAANGWLDVDERESVSDPREAADEYDAYYASTHDALGRPLAVELGGC